MYFRYKVVFIKDRFSKPEQNYQSEDTIYKFISEMLKGVKYCYKTL